MCMTNMSERKGMMVHTVISFQGLSAILDSLIFHLRLASAICKGLFVDFPKCKTTMLAFRNLKLGQNNFPYFPESVAKLCNLVPLGYPKV